MSRPPDRIESSSAWYGREMAGCANQWCRTLTADYIAELEHAAQSFLLRDVDISMLSRRDFPLPRVESSLSELSGQLLHGIGFGVLRGLPVADYSPQLAATIFFGIGAHLGHARSQNAMGHLLGHVRDSNADASDPDTRIYQTSERQTFHTDSADVVGLLCVRDAMQGGESLLVSTVTVYNEMQARRPDLVRKLFDQLATDKRGEFTDGELPFFEIPVFNWHAGRLTGVYQRQYIDSAQRFPDAMRLTEQHTEALDLFDELANDPSLNFSMRLEPGDMQFVYNHALMHDRTGFRDWPNPAERRHLLRLWLSMPGDRPLPECFRQRYGSLEVGNRGGIAAAGTKLHVPLD